MASAFTNVVRPIATVYSLLQCSRRLEKEQWLPAEELEVRRRKRFRQLLVRAVAAPYYRAVLRDAGIKDPRKVDLSALQELPLLDRQVIAQNGVDSFLTVEKAGLFGVTTSGSTGTPGRFLRSPVEEAEFSARWRRVYAAFGCGAFDAQVNVAGPRRPDRSGPTALLRRMGILPRIERLVTNASPEQVLQRVRALKPQILTGYAGAMEALAEHVLATHAQVQPPRAVFCTAMEVTDHCLAVVELAFRAPAVDVYVTNEFGVVAWSCPMRRNVLHLDDDSFVIEVIAPDGTPVPPGVQGELVVTSLGLTSMPLIRYRMGDLAARVSGPCGCGRGLGLLTRVQGRTAHAIRHPDGGLIITPLITSLFGRARAYEWVRQFQVREEPGQRLHVLLDARQRPSEVQWNALAETLQSGIGPAFQIHMEIVDRIPLAPSGKLQFLVPLAISNSLSRP